MMVIDLHLHSKKGILQLKLLRLRYFYKFKADKFEKEMIILNNISNFAPKFVNLGLFRIEPVITFAMYRSAF